MKPLRNRRPRMDYSEINDWEKDYKNNRILLKAKGKVVTWIDIDDLVLYWLGQVKGEEFEPSDVE